VEDKHLARAGGVFQLVASQPFPWFRDEPNDDPHDEDELGPVPGTNDMFSMDAPGSKSDAPVAGEDGRIDAYNFEEYVRVRFDGRRALGNVLDGSRASDKKLWHYYATLEVAPTGKWRRVAPPAPNEVGPGNPTPLF
jgi:hypothetical protein